MMRPRPSLVILAVVLGAAWLAIPPPSQAAFSLRLQSGDDDITITDGGVGDSHSATGAITFVGAVGDFILNVTTGLSKPIVGGPNEAHIDLNSVDVMFSRAGGTLTITLVDTFNLPPQPAPFTLQSMVGGTVFAPPGSTLTFQSWANSDTPVQLGPFGLGPFSGSETTTFSATGPFSLQSQAVITFTGPGVVSFNGNTIAAVPAPGGITLVLCAGVPFLGFCGLRRLQKKA
jgi:hypothetical protein